MQRGDPSCGQTLAGPGRVAPAGRGWGHWRTYDVADGLAGAAVFAIRQDAEGYLWFGTNGGASRYDGQGFVSFQTRNGLAHNWVTSILQDRKGCIWFGTDGGGVSRRDERGFTTFTAEDGLGHNAVFSILQDWEGRLWFGTLGGASRYDGEGFTTLTVKDGLVDDRVWTIRSGRQRRVADIAGPGRRLLVRHHERGVAVPPAGPFAPLTFIDGVVADRRYEGTADVEVPSGTQVVAFEFRATSFKTRPEAVVYRHRLRGHDADWRTTHARRVEYQDLPVGEYTFEVVAVDRDLVYSETPATVQVMVTPDPRLWALTDAISGAPGEFVGRSEALRRVQAQLAEVAGTDVTVLIQGETGTGKGLAARAAHALSGRRAGPFIHVNCGAIPAGLVESELFGHERGAFTGAVSRKLGKVELAEGGTLFLDEIGDLASEAQVKLLRVLEEWTFERVGGRETLRADVRVMAATNRDLRRMVAEGRFREDLYFRLQAFPVQMPPLRDRREDIPLLAAYFMARMATHLNKAVTQLTPEALARLNAYDWPGNIRELEHAVQRAVIVCHGAVIRAEDILLAFGGAGREMGEVMSMEEVERRHIREVLERTGWVVAGPGGAAGLLCLNASTLRSRMKRLGIRRR